MLEEIGAYDEYESLGRGTFGSVYLVKRKVDGQVACVKKLAFCPGNPSVSNPSSADTSFDKEVKALASVQHPNIVRVLGWGREGARYGEDGYRPWILLEYCSQGSLKGFIDRAKQAGASRLGVDEEQVVQWVKDVLSALKELHSRGIMHGDLKPANVVVHASGVAKVCNFDCATSSERTHYSHVGTCAYMAPQIVYGTGDEYQADADMFSVGVMVLEMFTLSRIPDAQAQGGDRVTDISKLLYLWYAGDHDIARQNEDDLHLDVRATLRRRVSRQWSDAVSKLVVGCLYFARDVRLTSSEASTLLMPCSNKEAAADFSAITKMPFTPVSLADEYTCPVCMEDLYPAMAYQCLHKVCANCAPSCADCPKCKAPSPPPRHDRDFSNLVEHQRNIAGFVCDTCFTSVSQEERGSHTCADALADRVFAMAASAGVSRADLRVDAQTVIRAKQGRPEMDRLEMDGMLTDLFLRRSNKADATALVLIDFDQVGARDAAHVPDLLTNLMDKLVRNGLAGGKAQVTLEAYGLCFSNKFNPLLIRNLTRLGVEMKTVSSAKREETDRHIERAARATEAPVVVIVSSDQDFVATAKELGQSGKKAVLVHDARAGSSHEKLMGFYGDAWRCDELVPAWGKSKSFDAEDSLFAADATICIGGEDVPVADLVRNKMFDEMRKTGREIASWCTYAKCKKGLECTFAHRKPVAAAGAQAASPSQSRAQASELTFNLQGKEVPTSDLVKNALFDVMKANPDHKAQWCPQREACKKGLECKLAHRKKESSELTFKIQGKQVPASELVKNKAYLVMKENPDHKVIWCKNLDACEHGLECTFAHRTPETVRAQTSKLTLNLQGKAVPASELVKNALFDVMKANPDHKAQWCPQREACKKGLECKLAHRKKESSANAPCATVEIDGEHVPESSLVRNKMFDERDKGRTRFQWCKRRDCQEGLECTFAHRKQSTPARAQASEPAIKIQGKEVPASDLVKNKAYLVMKANPDHKVIWCKKRDACEHGLECTFAHLKKKAPAAGGRASSSSQARAQASEVTFEIQGQQVAASDLVKNKAYLIMKAKPAHKMSWCRHRDECEEGLECTFAHRKPEAIGRARIMVAVAQDGLSLEHASEALKADKDIVMAAVAQNSQSMEHASVTLKHDQEMSAWLMARDN